MAERHSNLRRLRVAFLLLVLVAVGGQQWLGRLRVTAWDSPLWVAVYPINGDGSAAAARYIAALSDASFAPIEVWLARQARRYGLALEQPVTVRLAPEVHAQPPRPPADGNPFRVMLWSLQMRFWAWRTEQLSDGPPANISMFVKYFDPARHPRLEHSVGLQKGLLGVVNAYASGRMAGQNQVVITHELLHTLGASDKYDMRTLQPIYPDGFAEPERRPRYPQRLAEIMGGRIPLSPREARQPGRLGRTLLGTATAREIRWPAP
ncbi:hypothetical protein QVG61_03140 [Thiohalobacter sp. IOR34]|uniref:hypothetical protein n=1 Tax=Thiohalobacter sp. IOR34 TaxID=3057176 RepID=UPI0025AF444F|nr:hypothetical protein [Thiohalobacter sp. IOR34]WJW76102.1 hypothetical protein QVG61_03140 [Thiohalobacter sp. IOR34]